MRKFTLMLVMAFAALTASAQNVWKAGGKQTFTAAIYGTPWLMCAGGTDKQAFNDGAMSAYATDSTYFWTLERIAPTWNYYVKNAKNGYIKKLSEETLAALADSTKTLADIVLEYTDNTDEAMVCNCPGYGNASSYKIGHATKINLAGTETSVVVAWNEANKLALSTAVLGWDFCTPVEIADKSVTCLADFVDTELYTFTTPSRGALVWNGTDTKLAGSSNAGIEVDRFNANQQFLVLTSNTIQDAVYLYNWGAQKFLAKEGDQAVFTDVPTQYWTIKIGADQTRPIMIDSEDGNHWNLGGSGQITINSWSTADDGNQFQVKLAEYVTAADVKALREAVTTYEDNLTPHVYISSATDIRDSLLVTMTTKRGALVWDGESGQLSVGTADASNKNHQFLLIRSKQFDYEIYLVNAGSGKFVGKNGTKATLEEAPSVYWYLKDGSSTTHPIMINSQDGNHWNISSGNILIDSWSTADDGNQFQLEVVDSVSAEALIAYHEAIAAHEPSYEETLAEVLTSIKEGTTVGCYTKEQVDALKATTCIDELNAWTAANQPIAVQDGKTYVIYSTQNTVGLQKAAITMKEGVVSYAELENGNAAQIFTLNAVDGGYSIQTADGKYFYDNTPVDLSDSPCAWNLEEIAPATYHIFAKVSNWTYMKLSDGQIVDGCATWGGGASEGTDCGWTIEEVEMPEPQPEVTELWTKEAIYQGSYENDNLKKDLTTVNITLTSDSVFTIKNFAGTEGYDLKAYFDYNTGYLVTVNGKEGVDQGGWKAVEIKSDALTNIEVCTEYYSYFYDSSSWSGTNYDALLFTVSIGGSWKTMTYTWNETAVGIEEVATTERDNAPVYDLNGRRVSELTKGHIYVKNGKKFIAE